MAPGQAPKNVGVAAVLLAGLALLSPSLAEPPSAGANSAQPTLSLMRKALGDETALHGLTSLRVAASCDGPGGAFETEVASFRSSWTWFRQERSDGSTMEVWSGPERTWTIETNGATRDLGEGVRFFVRAHEFHFLVLEIGTRFSNHRLGSETTVREQSCVTVHMQDEAGSVAAVFLNRDTHLPVMLEMNPEGAAGAVRIYFENWETIAGVRLFRAFELTEGSERTFRYDYRSIEPNVVSGLEFVEPVPPGQHEGLRALLVVLEDDRRAHLDTDVARLVGNVADELLEVSSGVIRHLTRADVEGVFEQVFDGATYEEWDDLEPPRIKLSDDGTLAWVSRRVTVHRSTLDPNGVAQRQSFISAYSSTYEKQEARWKMTSVTSTFLAEPAD